MSTPEADKSAPKAVAAIDIGSNSVRMLVAQVSPDGHIEVLERTQRPVRLGHDTFVAGRLMQRTMNAAITILRDYKKLITTYAVETVRAVATSAVREASNGDAFVDRVAMAVDIDVEVLDPAEESRLTVSAVREAGLGDLGVNSGKGLIVDVGGGSTLLTALQDGEIAASESCALGSIRLLEHLATANEPVERGVDILRRQIANVVDVLKRSMPLEQAQSFIAVGEDARFAAQRAGEPVPTNELAYTMSRKAFDRLVADCVRQTPEKLSRKYALPFANAERLTPALLICQAFLRATSLDRLISCGVSMRDGLLLDLARRVTGDEDPELAESVVRSARSIGEKYRYDARHGEHVAALSLRLFDELQKEHGLTPRHRLLLHVAGILHEAGKFVSNRAHHKHSYYLIANSEVFGLRRDELQVVADVARYHRRAEPKATHFEYLTLPREDRVAVNKLAAILRVADALERGHAQQVRDFQVELRPGELILYVSGVTDLTLERQAIAEKGDMFEDTYGLTVRLEESAAAAPETRRASPIE